jgi:ABC-type uncharacterized transport system ATPase subunit
MGNTGLTIIEQETNNLKAPEIMMENITKTFGKLIALDKVSFNLKSTEIRALVGENGAGKSTLMNILYGVYSADSGSIILDGKQAPDNWNPNIAIANGIGMIHQHFSLIYPHTVLENIVMPTLRWTDFKPQWKKYEQIVEGLMKKYHFSVDLDARIENISIGERQQVEILKALYQGARVLILDEPTSVLTPQQAESLLEFLVELRAKGYSVVLVTHKLQEAMAISDKTTILRGGKHIATVETKDTSIKEIAKMMVDRNLSTSLNSGKRKVISKRVLQLKNITVENKDKKVVVDDVSFDIGEGEIVGIAGVAGNGQTELAETIVGLRQINSGELIYRDRKINKWNVAKRRAEGIGFIPEDRLEKGMVGEMTLKENLILDCMEREPYSHNGIVRHKEVEAAGDNAIETFNVKAGGCHVKMETLSGGNQQKVVLARTLMGNPRVIIACQPTRGLDFSATNFLRTKLIESAQKNLGVLVISSDLDELMELADRIVVMFRGKVVGDVKRDEVDLQKLGLMMAGYNEEEKD